MKTYHYLLLLIILSTITGCYTTGRFGMLNIEVLQPAIIQKEKLNTQIAVLYNNSNIINDSLNRGFIYDNKVLFDTVNTDSLASVVYYESFLETIKSGNYFDSITDLERRYPIIGNDSIHLFSNLEADSLKKLYNCEVIYSFIQFRFDEFLYTKRNYQTGILITAMALWAIYSSSPDTSMLALHRDTINFSTDYTTFKTDINILKDRPDLLMEAAEDLGKKFAYFLIPHWEEVERLYYKSGNTIFSEAAKLAQNNEWIKAAEIWKKLITNKNKNIVVKSMYNLAVACEMEGNLDAALDWVIKSFQVFGQNNSNHAYNCLDYIKILSTRKLEIKNLKNQISE